MKNEEECIKWLEAELVKTTNKKKWLEKTLEIMKENGKTKS